MFSLFTQPCLYCICTVDSHAPVAYPEFYCQHNVYTLYNRQPEHAHAPVVFHKRHLSSSPWLVLQLHSCQLYENLTLRPHVARYHIKLQCQIYTVRRMTHIHIYYIHIYIRENLPFNSLVWGSLTLAPNTSLPIYYNSESIVTLSMKPFIRYQLHLLCHITSLCTCFIRRTAEYNTFLMLKQFVPNFHVVAE